MRITVTCWSDSQLFVVFSCLLNLTLEKLLCFVPVLSEVLCVILHRYCWMLSIQLWNPNWFLAFLSHQRHKHRYKWNYCSAGVNKHPFEALMLKSLEGKSCEKWLRELGLFSLERGRLRGTLLLSVIAWKLVPSCGLASCPTQPVMRGNGLKLLQERFRLNIKKNLFMLSVVKYRNELTREMFRKQLDVAPWSSWKDSDESKVGLYDLIDIFPPKRFCALFGFQAIHKNGDEIVHSVHLCEYCECGRWRA